MNTNQQKTANQNQLKNNASGGEFGQEQVEKAQKTIIELLNQREKKTFTYAAVMVCAKPNELESWKVAFNGLVKKGVILPVEQKMLGMVYRLAEPHDKKPMTEAMQKIDAYRDQRVSHFEITDKHLAEDFSSVVYFYNGHNGPVAIGFSGRSKKFSFHVRFKTAENRAEYVTNWMQQQKERVDRRKPEARALKVGAVLYSSWGYEQTNIDYYLVTKLIGKQSVEIVEIGREIVPTGDMQGRCVPDKNNIIGEPMRRRVDGDRVRINSCVTARKKTPKIVAGCEIYDTDSYTSYH